MVASISRWLDVFVSAIGKMTSGFVVVIMLLVVATVVMSSLQLNTVFAFDRPVPVLGSSLTLNTLIDLQWYLFAYFVMCGLAYTLVEDGHVRVDFISSVLSPKKRALLQLFGNALFLLPFCILMIRFSYSGTVQSYLTQERSSYDGLGARWLVKLPLLIGFVLLALAGLSDSLRQVSILFSRANPERRL